MAVCPVTALRSPSDVGFGPGLTAIDRCQVGLLREVASQMGNRLVLKGGMAMRAAFGSLRLTKDIDFDRDSSLGQDALKKSLERLLMRAAVGARISAAKALITKDTATTVRARLEGATAGGEPVRFEVEVSGRSMPLPDVLRTVTVAAPAVYAMAPFSVLTYTNDALAAMKIGAALSQNRYAARDLYDLRDLIQAGVDPIALLTRTDRWVLEDFAQRALDKLEMLSYSLAEQELLPYLPVHEREALTEDAWISTTITVAEHIQDWCSAALRRLDAAKEPAP